MSSYRYDASWKRDAARSLGYTDRDAARNPPYGASGNIIVSSVATNNYLSYVTGDVGDRAFKSSQAVTYKAIEISKEIDQVARRLKEVNQYSPNKLVLESMGNALCQKMGKHFLYEADHNTCGLPTN